MLRLGAALADALTGRLQIHLSGDLGAGKTTLVRGVLRQLGYQGKVKSPTFTLLEVYAISSLDLYHFDFYRFNQPEAYLDAGLDEYFARDAVCLVEWPDKSMPYIPGPDLRIDLQVLQSSRRAQLCAGTPRGIECLTAMKTSLVAHGLVPASIDAGF